MTSTTNADCYDVLIVGGGAAGVGVAITLLHAGIENFAVLERNTVGASFDLWPAETRFITPSFPTNSIGMLDLNSIAIGVSPAYSLMVEHPTGAEYAKHLRDLVEFFEVPTLLNVEVKSIAKDAEHFAVETEQETLHAKHIIWAAGEFQYPSQKSFPGAIFVNTRQRLPVMKISKEMTLLLSVAMKVVSMLLII